MTIDIDALEARVAEMDPAKPVTIAVAELALVNAAPALLRLARLGAAVIAKEHALCTCAVKAHGVPCDAMVAIVAYDTAYAAALEVS